MVLNDLELAVIATKSMRYSEDESLAYLKTQGHEIQRAMYYRILGRISAEAKTRAYEVAKSFLEDHMNILDELENNKKMIYQDIALEGKPFNRVMMRIKLTETMIPYITAFREATKMIIENVHEKLIKDNNNDRHVMSIFDT